MFATFQLHCPRILPSMNGFFTSVLTCTTTFFLFVHGQVETATSDLSFKVPTQEAPPMVSGSNNLTNLYNFNSKTNLVKVLKDIRGLMSKKDFDQAQSMARAALSDIDQTEQYKFYLQQIRKEETKVY